MNKTQTHAAVINWIDQLCAAAVALDAAEKAFRAADHIASRAHADTRVAAYATRYDLYVILETATHAFATTLASRDASK